MRIEKCVREGNIYVVYIIMYIPTAFTGQEQNGTVWFLSSKWHVPPWRWERSLVRQMVPPEDTGARQNSREERRNRHAKNRKQLGKYYAN